MTCPRPLLDTEQDGSIIELFFKKRPCHYVYNIPRCHNDAVDLCLYQTIFSYNRFLFDPAHGIVLNILPGFVIIQFPHYKKNLFT